MKTKFFLAAAMVAFSFAMVSCVGNKTANSDAAADSTSVAVEAAESAATCCKSDSVACDSTKACCKDKAILLLVILQKLVAKIKLRAIRKQSALRKKIVQKKLAIRNNQQVATV